MGIFVLRLLTVHFRYCLVYRRMVVLFRLIKRTSHALPLLIFHSLQVFPIKHELFRLRHLLYQLSRTPKAPFSRKGASWRLQILLSQNLLSFLLAIIREQIYNIFGKRKGDLPKMLLLHRNLYWFSLNLIPQYVFFCCKLIVVIAQLLSWNVNNKIL